MKNYVKRNRVDVYEKSRIEIDRSEEWVYLTFGLRELLKKTEETISLKEGWLSGYVEGSEGFKKTKESLEYSYHEKELIEKMLNDLDCNNSLEWDS